jgi:hypothetical protein
MKRLRRSIALELEFIGDGGVVALGPGSFRGGVPDPTLAGAMAFECWREVRDEDGSSGPAPHEPTVRERFQINVAGTSAGFRSLGAYLVALSELDTTVNPDFHQHLEVVSADARTELHFILRKVESALGLEAEFDD